MRTKRVSEIKRAEDTDGVLCQTHIGGQALIEGVMMRGRYSWAAAIRQPDGTIYTEEHDLAAHPHTHKWLYWPVIRGCRALVESLVLGYKALDIAAEHAYEFDEDEDGNVVERTFATTQDQVEMQQSQQTDSAQIEDCATVSQPVQAADLMQTQAQTQAQAQAAAMASLDDSDNQSGENDSITADEASSSKESNSDSKMVIVIGAVLGSALALVLFLVLPAFVTNLVIGNYDNNPIIWNIVDGVLRVAIFILYVWLIAFMKDIKRMFQYHGAEHKTIHCFEHGLELTPENAAQFSTLHVRCGTAFIIMVLILAIIVFSFVPIKLICVGLGITNSVGQFFIILLSRIILLPVVAGLGYEITVRWAGAHPERKAVRVVLWPGLQMQKLTTGVPDEGMLECAITAMKLVIAREEREAAQQAEHQI